LVNDGKPPAANIGSREKRIGHRCGNFRSPGREPGTGQAIGRVSAPGQPPSGTREEGSGRPTKRERRDIDRLLGRDDFGSD
jgi:hypothetical protein